MLGILILIVIKSFFVTRSEALGILFSTAFNWVLVAKPLTSGILFSNSDLSVSYLVFKTNPLVSILFTLVTNLSYASF